MALKKVSGNKRNAGGFTLVEIIVVLVILYLGNFSGSNNSIYVGICQ